MLEIFPNYYHKFSCIADRCKHNCCIGWEIDIDEQTMQLYALLEGEMSERIRQSITGDSPHFVLDHNDRCPFLNSSGLCDIICEYGERALCDICAMHPRFCNFYSSFTEIGLGLCCEEAARIILSQQEKALISIPGNIELTSDEKVFFEKRREIFDILQDRSRTVSKRFTALAEKFGFEFDFRLDSICDLCLELERMDEKWTSVLTELKEFSFDQRIFDDESLALPLEQLAVYFVFRHLGDNGYDNGYCSSVRFVLMSCYIIGAIFAMYHSARGVDIAEFFEIARMYSAEIEYSDENTDELMMFCL